jgi:hypothetical protein
LENSGSAGMANANAIKNIMIESIEEQKADEEDEE